MFTTPVAHYFRVREGSLYLFRVRQAQRMEYQVRRPQAIHGPEMMAIATEDTGRSGHMLHIVKIDGRRQVALTDHFIATFFDVYMNGVPALELKARAQYPEINFVH